MWLRSLEVWFILVCAEVLHGIARVRYLNPRFGDFRARQVAVFTGSVIILVIATTFAPWIGATRGADLAGIGAMWVGLMVTFELLFGRLVLHVSWARLGSDYNLRRGGLLPLGLAVLALAPWLAVLLRGMR